MNAAKEIARIRSEIASEERRLRATRNHAIAAMLRRVIGVYRRSLAYWEAQI